MKISGSILSSKITAKEAIEIYNKTDIDYIHLDIMDGKFVDNKTWTMSDINKFSKIATKSFDVHLMVNNPDKYIDELSMMNTSYITFHYEAVKKPLEIINHIKNNGIRCGIAINPSTNVSEILPLLKEVDLVLIMSVVPGASGQSFMDGVLYKLEVLKKEIEENHLNTLVSIDGGINDETYLKVKDNVDIVVSASYLLEGNTNEKINAFKNN